MPVRSVTDLHKALTGAMVNDPDIVCTDHGDGLDDQDDDPEGRADLGAQYADAAA
ncbi:hypothetical protein [Streptomyces sp. MN13]